MRKYPTSVGASNNHHAWEGGWKDHTTEVMNLGVVQFYYLDLCRSLPFSVAEALEVLYLHDIEKPFRYGEANGKEILKTKKAREEFRLGVIEEFGIALNESQQIALKYCEGENDDYTPKKRVMNELGAFCHACDVLSARLWHDQGKEGNWNSRSFKIDDQS
jgi:hypothetical protein